MDFCKPAHIYLIFSLLGSIIYILTTISYKTLSEEARFIFWQFIAIIVWTCILNILCWAGFSIISWILVAIPLIALTIIIVAEISVLHNKFIEEKNKEQRTKEKLIPNF
uniref:Uncharacterized protein n=1 Tax=viral metagenome TaxID=1070528 RepID=A0A6C0JJS5_9ZZZZ